MLLTETERPVLLSPNGSPASCKASGIFHPFHQYASWRTTRLPYQTWYTLCTLRHGLAPRPWIFMPVSLCSARNCCKCPESYLYSVKVHHHCLEYVMIP